MTIGIGLPVDDPAVLHDWAARADAGPFATLGLLDRLVWHNPEPLVTLAVLAGATARIRLQTEVLLAPLRATALLGSQVATLDRLCGGRFTLGLGIGGRDDDFAAADVDPRGRGARLDAQLRDLRSQWAGTTGVGPAPLRPRGPEILLGAFRPAASARVARHGDGLLCAAAPSWAEALLATVAREWVAAGREGMPRNVAQVNVARAAVGRRRRACLDAGVLRVHRRRGPDGGGPADRARRRRRRSAGLRGPGRRRAGLLPLGAGPRPARPARRPGALLRHSVGARH
ncbi:Luciferase-like, subgroup [Pseudonocardia dioxanivorans CB1190]|uniref:Luciferase-like, subgroup n=1 Tax=Pseudonocardia dioxanivorans (strain ATCC 55486 / DSM 44775 / JCM 13855 / CB1190) TaxID=675635 RepID=F4CPA7_PSEUX|nr:LLM class flavin-dependent oxidoreductase [Pseudonocardia dioxanivorans]AEA24022.1 Luciferase-like, subgroup [Pseudonocardia dioxanivorans CB1190]